MRGLFRRLFGIFMVLATASMIAQDADKKIKELVAGIKIGTTGVNWPENVEEIVEKARGELLDKVDKPELFDSCDVQGYIVSLEPELVQETRRVLKSFDFPDFIEKMPILGIKFVKQERSICLLWLEDPTNKDLPSMPYAILLNTELFSRVDDAACILKQFLLFREIGRIRAFCSGLHLDREGEELDRVVADIHSLAIWPRIFAPSDVKKFFHILIDMPYPHLNCWELVYYAEQLFADQKKGGSFDVLAYAKKIIADRKKDSYAQDISECVAEFKKSKLLAKIDKPELYDIPTGQCYITSLEPELVQEVRDALKLLDIPDSFIEKMLIVGMKPIPKLSMEAVTFHSWYNGRYFPWGIGIAVDDYGFSKPSFKRMFTCLHEAGHIKTYLSGIGDDIDDELDEVIPDVYALDVCIKLQGKECFRDLIKCGRALPYLNPLELIYYADKLLLAQQKGDKIDVPAYARKIVAERKKDGYKKEVLQEVEKLLDPTDFFNIMKVSNNSLPKRKGEAKGDFEMWVEAYKN